uniref:Uncharacterized protein n=1 Tax=Anguilla anguilla TaxID=7936 RepID=A0A0E9X231_ANGAN
MCMKGKVNMLLKRALIEASELWVHTAPVPEALQYPAFTPTASGFQRIFTFLLHLFTLTSFYTKCF